MNEPRLFLAWNKKENDESFNYTVFHTSNFADYIMELARRRPDGLVDLSIPFAVSVMPCTEAQLADTGDFGDVTLAPSFDNLSLAELKKLVLLDVDKEINSQKFYYLGEPVHRFGTGWLYNNRNYLTERDVCEAINKVIMP